MTMQRLAAAPVLFAILLGGCMTPQPIPEMSLPQSSGLGIEIRIGTYGLAPDRVYFARIDNEDGLLQQQIYISNYAKDGLNADGTPGTPPRAYLLNARPGTYVAVAGYRTSGGVIDRAQQNSWYFSKKLVELTKVTVRENDFAFMGSYVVSSSVGLGGADEVQTHYKKVIAPDAPTGVPSMIFFGNFHRLGTLGEHKGDETSRNEFFLRAKEDLAGSKWVERFK